ncbi:glycosyltransferase [uncultured Psychroserpens sp.]|uniref:glycosyltransferase n=1 Tax=uncultured Psychroserpens sp. TaxID=255436 RepID=UPI00262ED8C7|nr:glycosyltransferase [uncultured Psychroserpens sp.]
MKHYLITRFNLKNANWHISGSDQDVLSKQWLDHRFEIFESYCLPSVENQTCNSFTWLVCFDINTPKNYLKKIDDLNQQLSNFQPLFIDGFDHLESELSDYIKKDATQHQTHAITTRLDNDDIIHKDFIKSIQELSEPNNAAINISSGYQLILNNAHYSVRLVKKAFNPFMSVISTLENFESVISKEHHHWKLHPNIIINHNDRLWIQFVHGNNILNDISKTSKKTSVFNASEFGLKNIRIKEGKFEVILYNIVMYPQRLYHNLKQDIKHIFKAK